MSAKNPAGAQTRCRTRRPPGLPPNEAAAPPRVKDTEGGYQHPGLDEQPGHLAYRSVQHRVHRPARRLQAGLRPDNAPVRRVHPVPGLDHARLGSVHAQLGEAMRWEGEGDWVYTGKSHVKGSVDCCVEWAE